MFVEERVYTLAPGKSAEFAKLHAQVRATQERHLGPAIGYYYSEIGMLNQVVSLWAYGSLDERNARRAALSNDSAWGPFLDKGRPLFVTQETRILKPAPFFEERLESIVALGKVWRA